MREWQYIYSPARCEHQRPSVVHPLFHPSAPLSACVPSRCCSLICRAAAPRKTLTVCTMYNFVCPCGDSQGMHRACTAAIRNALVRSAKITHDARHCESKQHGCTYECKAPSRAPPIMRHAAAVRARFSASKNVMNRNERHFMKLLSLCVDGAAAAADAAAVAAAG